MMRAYFVNSEFFWFLLSSQNRGSFLIVDLVNLCFWHPWTSEYRRRPHTRPRVQTGAILIYQKEDISKSSHTLSAAPKWKSLSRVWLFATPWTVACQAPLFMGFSRQEYWSELIFPSPGDLPDPGVKSGFPALQSGLYPLSHQRNPKSTCYSTYLDE